MIETAPTKTASSIAPTSEMASLADCHALMVCLAGGRFVIVRIDEDTGSTLICAKKPDLRDLVVGDVVSYRGCDCRVQAVEVYR